jgi:hypothetical protein
VWWGPRGIDIHDDAVVEGDPQPQVTFALQSKLRSRALFWTSSEFRSAGVVQPELVWSLNAAQWFSV